MRTVIPILGVAVCIVVALLVLSAGISGAWERPTEPMSLKLEGARLPPVPFTHTSHVEKYKADCITCHHKDKDPERPDSCLKCHDLKEVKGGAVPAMEAFHKRCLSCHEESLPKGTAAPTKCDECHKE